MGIYLGQLPPAEIARLKAELAETVVANFCYPRFFDHRTEALQSRPVDRTKRQEVWLYLSSVDFTAWSRVDLMSADFQHHIERLFIQFVQRNRSFFGIQGRRRMFDVRVSISACAGTVAQRLRNYLTQQPVNPPFGSPRSVLSWSTTPLSGRVEPTWDQIMSGTMELQRQLQEWRGEIKPAATMEEQGVAPVAIANRNVQSGSYGANGASQPQGQPQAPVPAGGQGRRSTRSQQPTVNPANPGVPVAPAASFNPAASYDYSIVAAQQSTMPTPPIPAYPAQPAQPARTPFTPAATATPPVPTAANGTRSSSQTPVVSTSSSVVVPRRPTGALPTPSEQNMAVRSTGSMRARVGTSPTSAVPSTRPTAQPPAAGSSVQSPANAPARPAEPARGRPSPSPDSQVPAVVGGGSVRPLPVTPAGNAVAASPNTIREPLAVGEDDMAIFDQMRHQLLLWLRIEAISAGLEVSGQSPTELLEILRQNGRHDGTRLQVVSTLLDLANQVMKTGTVSVLDYKQALMFHLMHTRRP